MSNVITEGFSAYGLGMANSQTVVGRNMLAGAWAQLDDASLHIPKTLGQLPWDLANPDNYMSFLFGSTNAGTGGDPAARRVLPAANDVAMFSFYFAVDQLPSVSPNSSYILALCDSSNNVMGRLCIETTGALTFRKTDGTVVATTSGPVIVAESAVHIEIEANTDVGTLKVNVNGDSVIDAAGSLFTSPAPIAQFRMGGTSSLTELFNTHGYIGHLIVRDTSGDRNNTFPIGDRKVATLPLNRDDADNQGWEARPLHRFGVGILSLAEATAAGSVQLSAVTGPGTAVTDLGAGEFTIEGQFRFKALPAGATKAVLFGKWDESADKRSYQLYLGGPSLESGYLVFRTSTDGFNGTVVEKLKWPWVPAVGEWYHVALVRSSGELLLFIDGVQQGLSVADTDTYYAGTELPTLGAQMRSTPSVAVLTDTNFIGWMDEFRLSVGFPRYTSNFAPPTEGFPRGGDDPEWGSVAWLSSFDNAVIADDGPNGLALVGRNNAVALTTNDGAFAYQTINELTPNDGNFIDAALLPATGLYTLIGVPAPNDTVTLGTKDGSVPAVYKFVAALVTAFDVLIGGSIADTIANLTNAVIAGPGAGTAYGTGTTPNADADAVVAPSGQMLATALTAGVAGNSIPSTTTAANGSWGDTTLDGGQDIPGYSQFEWSRLPSDTSQVDSFTIAARQWRTAAGTATTQISFVGGGGEVALGAARPLPSSPTLTFDVFEEDPDTEGGLSPTSILLSKVRVDRTV